MSSERFQSELRCPICMDFFTEPTILPCSHILCRAPCAERLFATNERVKCPVCRVISYVSGGLNELPRVRHLENIIDLVRNDIERANNIPTADEEITDNDVTSCQLCSAESAVLRVCRTCHVTYCPRCLEVTHPDRPPFTGHDVTAPDSGMCAAHGLTLTLYCDLCRALACDVCRQNTHGSHDTRSLAEAQAQRRGELELLIQELRDQQNALSSGVYTCEQRKAALQARFDTSRSDMMQQFDMLQSALDARKNYFLADLDNDLQRRVTKYDVTVAQLRERRAQLGSRVDHLVSVVQQDCPAVFMQLSEAVDPLPDAPDLDLPVEVDDLQLRVVDVRGEVKNIQNISYLQAPRQPVMETDRCVSAVNFIAIVINLGVAADVTPGVAADVTAPPDGCYFYLHDPACGQTLERKLLLPRSESHPENRYAVIYESCHLVPKKKYTVKSRAYNTAGVSALSESVTVTTENSLTSIPAVNISTARCQTFTHSILVYCDVTREDGCDYSLLYRPSEGDLCWSHVTLYRRAQHRVFGLLADTDYDVTVMARAGAGGGKLSPVVTLRTKRDQ